MLLPLLGVLWGHKEQNLLSLNTGLYSQNHRITAVGTDLWWSSGATPQLKTGSIGASCPGLGPVSFWMCPRMESPKALCCNAWLHSEYIFCLLSQWNFLYLSLHQLTPFLSLDTTKDSGSVFLLPLIRYIQTLLRSSAPNLLFSRMNSPSSQHTFLWQMLQVFHHLCGSLTDLIQYVDVFLVLGIPDLVLAVQTVLTRTR